MQQFDYEIPKWEYDEYDAHPAGKDRRFLDRHGGYEWEFGYGFYGFTLVERDNRYYARCSIGSDCE